MDFLLNFFGFVVKYITGNRSRYCLLGLKVAYFFYFGFMAT